MLIDSIFVNLIRNPSFFRIVYPHIKPEYFIDPHDKTLYRKIKECYEQYGKIPTFADIKLGMDTDINVTVEDTEVVMERLKRLSKVSQSPDEKMLVDETEKYFQTRALENAILDAVEIIQDEKKTNKGIIEDKIKEALAVQFQINIGHDYFKDMNARLRSYEEEEDKIPLDIELLNEAMGGGLVRKAIFILMANTNVGKTIWLCHGSSSLVRSGKNVLYLTAEMSEKEINKRIDANILDFPIGELNPRIDKRKYKSKLKDVMSNAHGELIVKECSAGSMNAYHIRNLLHEIKLKKGYLPDVLVMDHLTLFASCRLPASQTGSHLYIRCVVEEVRAVAMEMGISILTACQFNRNAKAKKTDVSNEDVALGYAISETSDWSGAIIQTSELKEQNKYILKVLKTRFASNNEKIYTIGISYILMKLLNLNPEEQDIPMHIKDQLRYQEMQKDDKEEAIIFSFD